MRRIRGWLVFNGLLVGSVYLAYQLLLTDEAKQSLKDGVTSVVRGVVLTIDAIEEQRGILVDDDQPLPNVESTNAQWEAIGF